LLSLLVCAGLLALAWPRTQASLLYLPVDRAITRHWKGEPLTPVQLHALSQRAETALRRHPHYRYSDGLSLLSYLYATHPETTPSERRRALEASVQHAATAVASAPLQPMTWYRIAAASSSPGTDPRRAAAALEMSMLAGRVEPTLIVPRLQLAYRYRRWLGPHGQALLADQTLLAWRLQPNRLVQHWREGSISFSEVSQVLAAGHPDVLAEMEEAIARSIR
jgi:hypothetical protein